MTLAYLLLYYVFLIYGLKVKLKVVAECRAKGEPFDRYNGQYPELLAADRMQLNTLEHMPPFLTLLWLQAAVDTPQNAAILGSIYVLLRVLYPFFLGKTLKRYIPKRLITPHWLRRAGADDGFYRQGAPVQLVCEKWSSKTFCKAANDSTRYLGCRVRRVSSACTPQVTATVDTPI